VNHLSDCTLPEKILLAASALEEQGQSPFSAESLIVSAWQKYPHTFGLKGFEEQYPDSNKVLAMIMGEKGLPGRGWMVKVSQKQYALTRDGKQVVRKLMAGEEVPPLRGGRAVTKLTREQDLLLQQLLAAAAFEKFVQGRSAEWTFSEACRFWTIAERTGAAIDERLDELQAQLADVEKALKTGGVTLGNGKEMTVTEAGQLCDVHAQLEQRFARHLNLLRSRE
jgi:hypothetical protein